MEPSNLIVWMAAAFVAYSIHYMLDKSLPHEEKSFLGMVFSFDLSPPIQKIITKMHLTVDEDVALLIAKTISVAIYSFLSLSVLGTFGFDTSPLVAGIGITGFTVGFALKEIATNFLSGVLLVLDKPFTKGQYLKVLGVIQQLEGTVVSINARYVILSTKEGNTVKIPSTIVYSNPILVSSLTSEAKKTVAP